VFAVRAASAEEYRKEAVARGVAEGKALDEAGKARAEAEAAGGGRAGPRRRP